MNKGAKRKRPLLTILIVLLAIILCFLAAVFLIFRHYYSKSVFVDDKEAAVIDETADIESIEASVREAMMREAQMAIEEAGEAGGETGEAGEDGSGYSGMEIEIATLDPEEEEEIIREKTPTVPDLTDEQVGGTYNLLLIGVDRRDTSWNGNSDAMILATVNNNTKTIYLTSFMRDLYACIPNIGVRKLNHAYAVGAGPLLKQTLESNYGVRIDNYASVDFTAMQSIIDICGGVDVTIKDYELVVMRAYGITSPGTYTLNGAAALAYSRIRYYGNSDFERTSRQRTVLQALLAKARGMSASELTTLLGQLLPYVSHNLSSGQILKLIGTLPNVLSYRVQELRVPFPDQWYSVNEILVPKDMNSTINQIRSTIYAGQ